VPPDKIQHAPFTVDEIAGKNVGYCGLGHYHQQRSVPNPIDGTEIWYPGIPEGRGWDESGECGYLMGEIDGGTVTVTGRSCNQYPLQTVTIDCEGFSSREQIIEAILQQHGSAFDARTILRVRLQGPIDPRLELSIEEMEERVADKVLHIQWVDETRPALDFDALSLQNTLCGRFVRLLNRQIDSAGPEDRESLERARIYGASALLGHKPRVR
jgi:exonuclease SbcD